MTRSTPSFSEFDPTLIPFQDRVIDDVVNHLDYSLGTHHLLLSGSVGSAKSLLAAHIGLLHVLKYPRARLLLGRKALPDLKDTIFQKILEHIEGSNVEKVVDSVNQTSASIRFKNGSEIISRSWADRKFKKMRSLELSACIIEELTENDEQEFYNEISMRLGRLPAIPENWIISCTNPDAPSHFAYKMFYEDTGNPCKHIYQSVTTDNPFLPKSYIDQLKRDLDPRMARRMLYGEWLEIANEVVYYQYSKEKNYVDEKYQVNEKYPLWISWDFNIGHGKPLSVVVGQFIDDTLHVFDQVIVHGMRTLDSCEELQERGLLNHKSEIIVTGDATGRARDTRSNLSDVELIKKFFANHCPSKWSSAFPKSNGPIRKRHNVVNSYCENALGQVRLFVYAGAKTVDEALRLTQLRKGGQYIEDDSKEFQHCGTALGYMLLSALRQENKRPQQTLRF